MILSVEVEVKEGVYASVDLDFQCISPGYPASMIDPGEGPEFEIVGFQVCELYQLGVWEKTEADLKEAGWLDRVEAIVDPLLDDVPDLYELQYDTYTYG